MYSVIQFASDDGGTISVVNSQWLTPRKCEVYWPPVKSTKTFERLLPNAETEKNWNLYGVQRVFYETDSLEKAKQKLKLAEVTSDFQTEDENEIQRPKRRAIKRNQRYLSSDEEDENDNHMHPPPLKKQFINLIPTHCEETGLNVHTSDAEDDKYNNYMSSPALKKKIINSHTEDLGPVASTSTPKHTKATKTNDLAQDTSLPTLSTSILQGLEQDFVSTAEYSRSEKDKLTAYQEKFVSLLTLIKTQNDQILSTLNQKSTEPILNPDYKFPIKTNEELKAAEELLQNEEYYHNLVSYLATLGGRDTSSKVSRIMKTLFADCMAKDFNFYGKRSQKMPFCQLLLRKCVVESVKKITRANEKDIEDSIKVWLKHAPERLLKKGKKD